MTDPTDSPADPAPDATADPSPAPPPSQGSTDEAASAGDSPVAHDATDPDAIGGFTDAPSGVPELAGEVDEDGDDTDDPDQVGVVDPGPEPDWQPAGDSSHDPRGYDRQVPQ